MNSNMIIKPRLIASTTVYIYLYNINEQNRKNCLVKDRGVCLK